MEPLTVDRTPSPNCKACREFRRHTPPLWKHYHPLAGHGYNKEMGWTHEELKKHGRTTKTRSED